MTTIPIEVIVQDAEAPVVPGENGTNNTETNIPTTGNDEHNHDHESTQNSTVFGAVIAIVIVVAVVAVVAVIQKK